MAHGTENETPSFRTFLGEATICHALQTQDGCILSWPPSRNCSYPYQVCQDCGCFFPLNQLNSTGDWNVAPPPGAGAIGYDRRTEIGRIPASPMHISRHTLHVCLSCLDIDMVIIRQNVKFTAKNNCKLMISHRAFEQKSP